MTAAFRHTGPEAALAALAGLFPPGTAVAAEPIVPGREPWPGEAAAVAGAVPARRAEFAAGRAAARRALAALGRPGAALPAGPGRAPLWPEGVGGSIAHAAGLAVAAVREGGPLGLDLEEDAPLEPGLWPEICGADELSRLPGPDRGRLVRRVFAAKEAVYKAQYPLTGRLLGFDAVEVRVVPGGFTARFRETAGGFAAGHRMEGRIALVERLILAGVVT